MLSRQAARRLAVQELAVVLPRRWRHVQAVAAQAERLSRLPHVSGELLVAAAWLHDIGYAPRLASTGFHPLDGARFLRHKGAGDRLASLVAHHSCAVHEARVRGLEEVLLAEFERQDSPTYDALVFCDLTTGPDGEQLTYQARMDEIEQRYGPVDEVTRALELARGDLAGCCERTLALVAAAQVS
jgi:HD domain